MAWTEEEKAALAVKRGRAAAAISDPAERAKFVQAQGEAEKKGEVPDDDYKSMDRKADDTLATQGTNVADAARSRRVIGSFKCGGTAKKTGKYLVHKGEARVAPGKKLTSGSRFSGGRKSGR